MRSVRRQLRQIWYCILNQRNDGSLPVGNDPDPYDGEPSPTYDEAQSIWVNLSPVSGQVGQYEYGQTNDYTHIITTEWTECPITESTVLFVDKQPEYDDWGNPIYDYIVKRVEHSNTQTVLYVKRVEVGWQA